MAIVACKIKKKLCCFISFQFLALMCVHSQPTKIIFVGCEKKKKFFFQKAEDVGSFLG